MSIAPLLFQDPEDHLWVTALYEGTSGRLVEVDGYTFATGPAESGQRCGLRNCVLQVSCCLWPYHDGPDVGQTDQSYYSDGPIVVTSLRTLATTPLPFKG